jgi:hypothetical protein
VVVVEKYFGLFIDSGGTAYSATSLDMTQPYCTKYSHIVKATSKASKENKERKESKVKAESGKRKNLKAKEKRWELAVL